MTDVHYLTLSDLCRRLKSGELSAVTVTEQMLARVDELDGELRAFVTVLADDALASAAALDERRTNGEPLGALHGVPIGLKDLLWTEGIVTTCGTKVLADWVPEMDATIVTRLKQAGAVILGKTQLTEGAYGRHHPDVPAPRNPWNHDRWTGVSSSGSGVSVAAGLVFGAIGSDTGGSIRFPSSCCGLVGIQPTYGRVSRHGAFPLAESLDHLGPMTRSVEDAARMLQVMAGYDPEDPTSLRAPVPNYAGITAERVEGLRVGVDWDYVTNGVDPAVVEVVREALGILEDLGAQVLEVKVPDSATLVANWAITCGVECSLAHIDTYPSRAEEYGPALRGLIDLGRRAQAAEYALLERERERYRAELDTLLTHVELLIAPCMPVQAPTLSWMAEQEAGGGGTENAPFIQFTAPFNYSGHPTITLPLALDADGMPTSFQLIGPHLGEGQLIAAAGAFERAAAFSAHPIG
ncbi:MAG: amidase [Gammaproteobacteria bacterium]|nr:amidase [Gammaproteobacteria bacterium]